MRKTAMVMVMLLTGGLLLATVISAGATTWCGDNGLIRFSFSKGDSLVSVWDSGQATDGVTRIDLYAWLTDLDSVKHDGEVFTTVGAFELTLKITGAEAFILKQELPGEGFNVGKKQGNLVYGMKDGLSISSGRAMLAHWKIMFQGRPENVRFGLDPAGLVTCAKTEGCPGTGTPALYVGTDSSNQLGMLFGAGYEPAWLNPTGKPDTTPVRGNSPWQKVGVFEAR